MNIQKLLIGGIVGGVAFFLLGWLFYGILLMDFMREHHGLTAGYERPMPMMLYLVIGNLLSGFLLTYIFIKANVNSLANGLITGGVIGLLLSASYDTLMYATTTLMSRTMIAADVAVAVVMSAIAGGVIAMVIRKK